MRATNVTPSSAKPFWVPNGDGGVGNQNFCLLMNTTSKLRFGDNFGNAIGSDGTTTFVVNTDYRISVVWSITNGSSYTLTVYVNGVQDLQLINGAGIGGGSGSHGMNFRCDGNGATTTYYFSHIYYDDGSSGDPGGGNADLKVAAKRPVSNGSANNFTTQIGSGGSSYGSGHAPQVNELPLSQTNGWSHIVVGSAITEEYTVEGASVGDQDLTGATIIDYMGWIFAKALASETASIVVGGTSSNVSLTSTATSFVKAKGSAAYPAGGTDIGVVTATTATTVSLYECGVSIAYTPAAATKALPPANRAARVIYRRRRAA